MTWRNITRNKDLFLGLLEQSQTILVFDTETTGLGRTAKIIEFAAVRYQIIGSNLVKVDEMNVLINPQESLSEKITEITGITDSILNDKPTEEVLAPVIFDYMDSADIWAAYNIPFDLRMLNQMSDRTKLSFVEHPIIDVLEMAKDFVPKEESKSHKLGDIVEYLFPERHFNYHTALDDVRATAMCMATFIQKYGEYEDKENSKRSVHLNWASFFVNPNKKSQVRIKLNLEEGDYGDIFWDVILHCWSCRSSKSAKKLFNEIDLENLENQVLRKYGWKFNATNMSDLASEWGKDKRKVASGT